MPERGSSKGTKNFGHDFFLTVKEQGAMFFLFIVTLVLTILSVLDAWAGTQLLESRGTAMKERNRRYTRWGFSL